MGLINDRTGDKSAVTTTTKELPDLLAKVDIVNGFFHLLNGTTSRMYLVTKDGEAIVIPITDDFEIGLVSSVGLQEDLKEFAVDIDKQLASNTAELQDSKEKMLDILGSAGNK